MSVTEWRHCNAGIERLFKDLIEHTLFKCLRSPIQITAAFVEIRIIRNISVTIIKELLLIFDKRFAN
jgi:hypothetical protein